MDSLTLLAYAWASVTNPITLIGMGLAIWFVAIHEIAVGGECRGLLLAATSLVTIGARVGQIL